MLVVTMESREMIKPKKKIMIYQFNTFSFQDAVKNGNLVGVNNFTYKIK